MTWYGGVATLAGGEATPGREKRKDDTSWADANRTGQKIRKIHAINLVPINR
jgi:hypothetical protein